MMWGGMYDGGWGWGMGWGLMGLLHGVLWLVLIAMGIFVLARWLRADAATTGHGAESALDVLKKRYARGEIGKEEYEEKKRDLSA
ncbi:SHOCT domain-containing protein [Zeimonas arvi]|uniref:SHOCT domain-containing protein n=1 Tax=Zeimonas arvi TaxID=2498847 RepID=A0A5C8P3V1_9BURK|nr:SHOCT domain-containing protein [Zeimonas arvi]TXL68139.1 SHOCT domain-containing protein [Zeimonas arvi]